MCNNMFFFFSDEMRDIKCCSSFCYKSFETNSSLARIKLSSRSSKNMRLHAQTRALAVIGKKFHARPRAADPTVRSASHAGAGRVSKSGSGDCAVCIIDDAAK